MKKNQVMAVFPAINYVSTALLIIFLHSADGKLPLSASNRSASHRRQRLNPVYIPGDRAEKFLLCTVGGNATAYMVYPPDGLCNWIVYTHVRFNAPYGGLEPTDVKSWICFLRFRPRYNLSGLLPSHEWGNFSLGTHQARLLNRTLILQRMVGLAFLNVRIAVDDVPKLAAALETLAGANPGMFLILGATFHRLSDHTASRLFPDWLLDKLVTPLSVFVLETHVPAPGTACTAGFSTALQPVYGQKHASLTFRGARAFLEQPALRYANPTELARCVSLTAGALVFQVAEGHPVVLGAPCSGWSLEKVAPFCRLPTVSTNEEARSAYGWTRSAFFSIETTLHIWTKMRPALHSMLLSDLPTCLAVYSLDLDSASAECPYPLERTSRLVYTAYEAMLTMTTSNASDDSLFALEESDNLTNSAH